MRTRKRLRERKTDSQKQKEAWIEENIAEEDYEEVQRLLNKSSSMNKKCKSQTPSTEDRSSTEAENEHKYRLKNNTRKVSRDLRRSSDELDHHLDDDIVLSSSEHDTTEEKRIQNWNEANSLVDTLEDHTDSKNTHPTKKKRTLKLMHKVEKGFNAFINLIKEINDDSRPKLCLQNQSEDASFDEDINTWQKSTDFQSKKASKASKYKGKSNKKALKSIRSGTKKEPTSKTLTTRSETTANDASPEYSKSPWNAKEATQATSHLENNTESVSLVQNPQQEEEAPATQRGYPLCNNQSLHVQCAYFINYVTKYHFYRQQQLLLAEQLAAQGQETQDRQASE